MSINAGDISAKITVDLSELEDGLKKADEKTSKTAKNIEKHFENIEKASKGVGSAFNNEMEEASSSVEKANSQIGVSAKGIDFSMKQVSKGMDHLKRASEQVSKKIKSDMLITEKGVSDSGKKVKKSFEEIDKGVNNTSKTFGKFDKVSSRFAKVLSQDVSEGTREAAKHLIELERELRRCKRAFGVHSQEVAEAQKAITDYALGLDDATFKAVYMYDMTNQNSSKLQAQAGAIKLNARRMSLLGDATEKTNKHMEALQRAGVTPKEFLATPKTIGQMEMMNRLIQDSGGKLAKVSSLNRKIVGHIEKQIKGWSVNKIAIREAGDDLAKANRLAMSYSQNIMTWQLLFVGLVASAGMFYKKLFDLALETDESLKKLKDDTMEKLKEAFKPLIEVAGEFLRGCLEIASAVADMMIKFNEAHPELAKFISIIAFLVPAILAIISPLAIAGTAVAGFELAINSVWVIIGPFVAALGTITAPAIAIAAAIAALIASFLTTKETIVSLENQFGVFGAAVGSIFYTLQGVAQLTLGNIGILLLTLGKIAIAFFKGEWNEIPNIWAEGWAKIENNTAVAVSKINQDIGYSMDILKKTSSEEIADINNIFKMGLEQLPNLTKENAGKMATEFAGGLKKLDEDSLTILRGTSDTMAVLFEGISTKMDNKEATEKFKANLESMALSGEFTTTKLNEDLNKGMQIINNNMALNGDVLRQTATDVFNDFATASQFGIDGAVTSVVNGLSNINQETLTKLTEMGGTWKQAFEGIKLDGSMSTDQMKNAIVNNISNMKLDAGQLINQLREESSQYWSQIEQDTNTKSKSTADKAKQNVDKMAKDMTSGAKEGAKGVSDGMQQASQVVFNESGKIPKDVQSNMSKSVQSMKQAGSDIYNGMNNSFSKLASQGKQHFSDLYNGTTNSCSQMASKIKGYWKKIRDALSSKITGTVEIKVSGYQAALNKIQSVKNAASTFSLNNIPIEDKTPKNISYMSDRDYNIMQAFNDVRSMNLANQIRQSIPSTINLDIETPSKVKEREDNKKIEVNVTLNIEKFENRTDNDIEQLAEEFGFLINRKINLA
ncbi:Phage-related protein [[Clostridium] sordellii]|uniref:hypothetical protein n=1 Tax=Paraclostridium sordellii TaxID=1505 RepID=UPI0005E787A3|nr:hypothetical protein [Paeniclostridium sordellii]CEP46448.1 Phage-related protein [[Clostridium] sordellii] [Paeniclostridium sordellii]